MPAQMIGVGKKPVIKPITKFAVVQYLNATHMVKLHQPNIDPLANTVVHPGYIHRSLERSKTFLAEVSEPDARIMFDPAFSAFGNIKPPPKAFGSEFQDVAFAELDQNAFTLAVGARSFSFKRYLSPALRSRLWRRNTPPESDPGGRLIKLSFPVCLNEGAVKGFRAIMLSP